MNVPFQASKSPLPRESSLVPPPPSPSSSSPPPSPVNQPESRTRERDRNGRASTASFPPNCDKNLAPKERAEENGDVRAGERPHGRLKDAREEGEGGRIVPSVYKKREDGRQLLESSSSTCSELCVREMTEIARCRRRLRGRHLRRCLLHIGLPFPRYIRESCQRRRWWMRTIQ